MFSGDKKNTNNCGKFEEKKIENLNYCCVKLTSNFLVT
jgi:hypothetical protein